MREKSIFVQKTPVGVDFCLNCCKRFIGTIDEKFAKILRVCVCDINKVKK